LVGRELRRQRGRGAPGAEGMEREPIRSHKDLEVYQMAFDAAMKIFELSKKFPVEERYSRTFQVRRSVKGQRGRGAEGQRGRGAEGKPHG